MIARRAVDVATDLEATLARMRARPVPVGQVVPAVTGALALAHVDELERVYATLETMAETETTGQPSLVRALEVARRLVYQELVTWHARVPEVS